MLHGEHRYVSDFGPQAIERPTDLDGRTHKKTGHKMFTIIPPATRHHLKVIFR